MNCKIEIIKRTNQKLYRKFIQLIGLSRGNTTRNLYYLFQVALLSTLLVLFVDIISIFIEESSSFGTFGDFLGGTLNPILTFLTFMGLLITIILQQKELVLTRDEAKRSANALEEAKVESEKQTLLLIRSSQQTSIYNILQQTKIDLDFLLETHTSSETYSTKWNRFLSETNKQIQTRDWVEDSKIIRMHLIDYASSINFDYDRLSNMLDLYYSLLYELLLLETNRETIFGYFSFFKRQTEILQKIGFNDIQNYSRLHSAINNA